VKCKIPRVFPLASTLALLAGCASSQTASQRPHLERRGEATQLIVDGNPYLALAGEVRNSSSSSLQYMKPIWPKLAAAHLNTVLVPVSWELIELQEGQFDFTLVDGLIKNAREHHLHLAFLWFGTWKNMVSSYEPVWVRADPDRFACAMDQVDNRLPIPSTFSDAGAQADAKAFSALMAHVKQLEDAQPRKTVLMIQVENEVGLPGGERDRSPAANAAFEGPVPQELMHHLLAHKDSLYPDLKRLWDAAGSKKSGTWQEVFGTGTTTNEIFMAWNYARYIGKIIAAGKAEYPIPMFVNAAIGRQDGKLGSFPAGGPLAYVMDVWHAAAPQLDMLSPDIYYGSFSGWCEKYTRPDNPLFIPEMRAGASGAINAMTAVAQYHALGCSPFAIEDSIQGDEEYRGTLDILSQLSPLILDHQRDGTIAFVSLEGENTAQKLSMGRYTLNCEVVRRRDTTPEAQLSATTAPSSAPSRAYALVIAVGPDEYVVAGRNIQITFAPNPPAAEVAAVASIDEGTFLDGAWVAGRRLNGDETMLSYALSKNAADNQTGTGARFGSTPAIYRIKTVRYAGSRAAANTSPQSDKP
jgi:Domain of unknown function (DUF5597)